MTINEFANRCGYFFNAGTDPEALCAPNNGYNCNHPEQTEKQNGVGCCFQWSCPLAIPADEEDCEKYGIEYEEDEFVLVEDESGMQLPGLHESQESEDKTASGGGDNDQGTMR